MIAPWAIGRDVTRDEVIEYGFKHGQCGACDRGVVTRAVGRKATRKNDGSIEESYQMDKMICPVAHDRFLRRMKNRLAILETGRVHWQKCLEPEHFAFTMMFAASMLNAQDEADMRKHYNMTKMPWTLEPQCPTCGGHPQDTFCWDE